MGLVIRIDLQSIRSSNFTLQLCNLAPLSLFFWWQCLPFVRMVNHASLAESDASLVSAQTSTKVESVELGKVSFLSERMIDLSLRIEMSKDNSAPAQKASSRV
jgi:hypothetical protein